MLAEQRMASYVASLHSISSTSPTSKKSLPSLGPRRSFDCSCSSSRNNGGVSRNSGGVRTSHVQQG